MNINRDPRNHWLLWLGRLFGLLLAAAILILALAACKRQPTIWNPHDLNENNNGVPPVVGKR